MDEKTRELLIRLALAEHAFHLQFEEYCNREPVFLVDREDIDKHGDDA